MDTVGDAEAHRSRLASRFPEIKFTVCPKADSLFPIVSAASIVAKVTRDRHMRTLEQQLNIDPGILGSGYPSDPGTQEWLHSAMDPVFGFSNIVRFSWQTCVR